MRSQGIKRTKQKWGGEHLNTGRAEGGKTARLTQMEKENKESMAPKPGKLKGGSAKRRN